MIFIYRHYATMLFRHTPLCRLPPARHRVHDIFERRRWHDDAAACRLCWAILMPPIYATFDFHYFAIERAADIYGWFFITPIRRRRQEPRRLSLITPSTSDIFQDYLYHMRALMMPLRRHYLVIIFTPSRIIIIMRRKPPALNPILVTAISLLCTYSFSSRQRARQRAIIAEVVTLSVTAARRAITPLLFIWLTFHAIFIYWLIIRRRWLMRRRCALYLIISRGINQE